MLEIGEKAPDFTLEDQDGKSVSLTDFLGKKVLVWFYPKASTPGWTVQGQGLRDEFENYKEKNTIIIGMSGDSVKKAEKFLWETKLSFFITFRSWKKCNKQI